jgi:uncharacterized membrane protein (DUF2068 family)
VAPRRDVALWLIGGFKIVKGLVLVALGFATLRLLHHDVEDVVTTWATELHLNPESRVIGALLEKLSDWDPKTFELAIVGMFVYAALLLAEGFGLLWRKTWAEYFTIIMTGAFIPLEIWELVKRLTPVRAGVMVLNVAIVAYLVMRLRREHLAARALA